MGHVCPILQPGLCVHRGLKMNPCRAPRHSLEPLLFMCWRALYANRLPPDMRRMILRIIHMDAWHAEWTAFFAAYWAACISASSAARDYVPCCTFLPYRIPRTPTWPHSNVRKGRTLQVDAFNSVTCQSPAKWRQLRWLRHHLYNHR